MKAFNVIISIVLLTASVAFAKSSKKSSADSDAIKFDDPQVLEVGDQLIGVRTGLGNIMNGGPGLGFYYSYQNTKNVSIDGQLYYSTYNVLGASVTSMLFVGSGSFHADLLHAKNLDTYASAGLYYNSVSVGSGGGSVAGSTSGFTAAITARYFMNSQWSVSGSLGNLGTLIVGLDYTL